VSVRTRVDKLEAQTSAEVHGPMILIHFAGETREQVLARYGLPEDYEHGERVRITIGGIDLHNV